MLPPIPMSSAWRPHASARERCIASYAAPFVWATNGSPADPGVTFTSAPHGAAASRCAHSARSAASAG